ncbi:MAG: SpaA isopeptide-forming pilin-related protein, partial [Clostridia bacterium]|nr:SpaA isopeptide-forming pilin-related protein [Clostridia bacterium]
MELKPTKFYQTRTFRRLMAILMVAVLVSNNVVENMSTLFAGEQEPALSDIQAPANQGPEEGPDGTQNLASPGDPIVVPPELAGGAGAAEPGEGEEPGADERPGEGEQPGGGEQPPAPRNAAEDPSFYSGYAVALESATVYRNARRASADALIRIGAGEALLASARKDVEGVAWFQVSVKDKNDKAVTGWVLGTAIIALSGEELLRRTDEENRGDIADYIVLDGNGVPQVSAAAIEHKDPGSEGGPSATPVPGEEEGEEDDDGDGSEPGATPEPTPEPTATPEEIDEQMDIMSALGAGFAPLDGELLMPLFAPFDPGDPDYQAFLAAIANLNETAFAAGVAGNLTWDNDKENMLLTITVNRPQPVIPGNTQSLPYFNYVGNAVNVAVTLPQDSPLKFLPDPGNYDIDLTSNSKRITFGIDTSTGAGTLEPGRSVIMRISITYDYTNPPAQVGTQYPMSVQVQGSAFMGYLSGGERVNEADPRAVSLNRDFTITVGERTYVDADWDMSAATSNPAPASVYRTFTHTMQAFLRDKDTGLPMTVTEQYRHLSARADLEQMYMLIQIDPLNLTGAAAPDAKTGVYPDRVRITNSNAVLTPARNAQDQIIPGAYIMPVTMEMLNGRNVPVYTRHVIEIDYLATDLEVAFYEYNSNQRYVGAITSALLWQIKGGSVREVKNTNPLSVDAIELRPAYVNFEKLIQVNGATPVQYGGPAQSQYPTNPAGALSLGLNINGTGTPAKLYTRSGGNYVYHGTAVNVYTPNGKNTETFYLAPGQYRLFENGEIIGFTLRDSGVTNLPRNQTGPAIDVTGINSNGGLSVTKVWEINGVQKTAPMPDAVEFTVYTDPALTQVATMILNGAPVPARLSTTATNATVMFSLDFGASNQATFYVAETVPTDANKWFDREPYMQVTVRRGELTAINYVNKIAEITVRTQLEIGNANSIYTFDSTLQGQSGYANFQGVASQADAINLVIGGKTYRPVQVSATGNPFVNDEGELIFRIPESEFAAVNAQANGSYEIRVNGTVRGFGREAVQTTTKQDGALPKTTDARFYMGVVELSKMLHYPYDAGKFIQAPYNATAAALIGNPAISMGLQLGGVNFADIHALDKIGSGSNVRYALDFSAGAIPTGTSRVNVRPMNNGEMRAIIGVPNNPAPATYTFYETVNSADFWPQIGAEPASASVTLSIGNPAQRIVSGYITNQPRKYGAVVIEKFVSEGGTTLENANFQRLATLPANFNPSFTLTAIGSAAPAAGHTDQILQHLDAGSRIVAVFPHIPLGQTATIQENTAGMPGYAPVNGHNAPANWLSDNNTITVSLPASPPQASQFAAGKFYNIRSQAIMALTMQILKRDAAAAVNRATGEGGAFVYNLYRIVPTPGSNTGSVTIGGVTVHYILLPETTFTYNNTNAHLIELPVNIPSSVAGPTVEYVLIQEQHASYEIAPPQLVTLTKGSLVPTPVAVVNKELTRLTISTKQYALTHNTTTHATTAIDGAPWPGSGLTPALTYRITGTPANGSTFTPVSGAVNASGQTVFNMPAGTYTIAINSTLPTGYRRMDDPANDWRTANEIVVTVDSAKSEARTSMLENPNGTICLHKVDSATGAGLGGAVFTRYLGDSGAASQGAVTTSTAAATLGQAVFTNIAPGAYSLIETTAPTGYYGSKDRILVTVPAPAMVGGNYTVPAGVACFSDTVNFARLRAPNTRFTTFQMHKRNVLNGVESNAGANNTYATIMVASGDTYVPFDFTPNQYGNGVEVTPRAGTGSTGLINWRLPAGTYYIFEEPANRYYPGLGDAHSPAITVRERRTFNIGGTNRTGWLLGPYTVTTPTAATTLTHTVRNYYDTVSGVDLFAFANFFASGSASEIDWLNGGVYRLVNVAAPATFYNSTTRTVGGRGAHLFTNGTLGVPVFATSGDNIGAPIEYRVEVATPHARYFRLNSLGSAVRQVALTDADGRVLPASGASAFTPAVPAATDYEGRARQQLSGPKYSYSTFNLYDIMRITEGGNNTRPHLSIQNERRAQIIVPVAGVDCLAHERSTGLEGVTVGLYDRDGARIATTVTGAGGIATFAASDDFYLSAEADYIVVQLSKHGDYIVGSCESPRGLPANLGQLSAGEVAAILSGADTTLNAAAVRCAAFQISDTAPQFFVANVARLENHKPYMRIELTKNWHHVNSAGRYNMQHFGLFEVTYNSANGAAACSEQMSEYVTSVIYGQHGKIITDPVEYGKMYALVEKPASSPRAIHLVMEQSAYDQLLAAGLTTGAPEALPNITHDNDLRLAPWRKRVTNLTHPFAAAVIDAVKGKAGYAGFDEIYITPYDAGYINESKLVPTFADNPRGTGTFRWHIGRIILQKMYIDDFGVTRPRNGVTFAFSLVNTNEDGTVRHRPDGAEDVQPALGLSTTSPRLHEGVLTHGIADSGSFFLHDWRVYPLGPENQENYYWFIRSGGMFFGQDGEEINALRIGAGVPHNFTAAEKARLFTTQAAAQAYAQANAAAVGSNAVVELAYAMPHHPQRPNAQCAGCLARVRISEVGGADGLTVLTDVQDAFVICNADSTDELTIVSHVYYVQNPIVNGDPLKNTYFRVVKYGYQPTSVSAAAWDAIARHYTDPYDRYNAFGEWLAGHLTNATVPNLPAISGAYPSGTLTGVQFQVFKKEGNNYLPVKDSAGNNVIITTSMFGLTSSPVLEAGVEYYLSEITGHPDYINNHNAGSGNAVTDAARLIKVGLMTNANYGRTVYVSNPRKIDLVIEGVDRYNTSVAIPGVSYTLYHSNASGAQGTAVGTGTAGADGQVQFGGLDVGYYLLRANSGWDAARYVNFTATQGDPNVPGGTVNYRSQGLMLIYVPGGTSNLTSTSADMRVQALYPPLPFVGVNKTARVDGARLPGVTLQLLRAGAVIETLTTDANGQVLFATPLTPATYTIVESATGLPSHLMLPANTTVVASFTVSAAGLFSSGTNPTETIGGRVDVVRRNGVVNDRKTRLDIRKLVTENGSTSSPAGAGVVFSVRRNGADYGTITTDALGVASLEMTAFGTYVLEETAGPAGYIAVPGTITVTFSGTGAPTIAFAGDWSTFGYVSRVGSTLLEPSSGWNVFTANVTNPKPFSITAQKVDGLGIDLPGARFGLYTSSACTLESMVRSADSDGLYGTGGTGVLTIGGLLPGKTYYLREEVPPDGYEKSAQVYTVTSARTDAGTAKQVGVGGKIANYKGSGLQIFKDVAWVGEEPMHNGDFALPKIVFDIYHATGSDNHNKGDLAATVEAVRISAGKYRTDIVPLLPGHYLVEEMTRQTLTGAALIVDPHPPYAAPYSSYLWKAQVYQEGQGDILTPLLLGNAELSSSVTIRKVNKTTGTPVALPGAQFKLYTLRNTTLTGAARYAAANQQTLEGAAASYTTGANGEVTATVALPSNSGGRLLAVIEELAPPPGYLIDPTRRYTEVVLFAGSSAVAMPANESVRLDKIEIANDTAGTIILHDYIVTRFLSGTDTPAQYDGDFPLANVAFTLYYRASQEEDFRRVADFGLGAPTSAATQTTDANGRVSWTNLPMHYQYAVHMQTAPDYVFDTFRSAQNVGDFSGGAANLIPSTEQDFTGDGVRRTLYIITPNTLQDGDEHTLYYKVYHKQKGSITIEKHLEAIPNPAAIPAEFTIWEGELKDGSIVKRLGGNNQPIPATFEYSGDTVVNGVARVTGKLTIHNVNTGYYVIEETKAPSGYMLNTDAKAVSVVINLADPRDESGLHHTVRFVNEAYAANTAAIRKLADKARLGATMLRHDPSSPLPVADTVIYTLDNFVSKYNPATGEYTSEPVPYPYESFVVTDKGLRFSAVENDFINAVNQLPYADYARSKYQFTQIVIGRSVFGEGVDTPATARVEYQLFAPGDSETLPAAGWVQLPGAHTLDSARTVLLPAGARAFRVVYDKPGVNFRPGAITVSAQLFVQPDGMIGGQPVRPIRAFRNEAAVDASFHGVGEDGAHQSTVLTTLTMNAVADVNVPAPMPPALVEVAKRTTGRDGEPWVEGVGVDNLTRVPVPVIRGTLLKYTIAVSNRSNSGSFMPDPLVIDRLPEDFELIQSTIAAKVVKTGENDVYTFASGLPGDSVLVMGDITVTKGPDMHVGDGTKPNADALDDDYVVIPFTGNLLDGETLLIEIEGTVPYDLRPPTEVIEINDAILGTKTPGLIYVGQPQGYTFLDYGNAHNPPETSGRWIDAARAVAGNQVTGVIRDFSRYSILPINRLEAAKYARGDADDSGFSSLLVARSYLGGALDYNLTLSFMDASNEGSRDYSDLRIVDTLPQVGDGSRPGTLFNQASSWTPLLDSVKVDYSYLPDGVQAPEMELVIRYRPVTAANDYSDVASGANAFLSGSAGSIGGSTITLPPSAPNTWTGIDAYFAQQGWVATAFSLEYKTPTTLITMPSELMVSVGTKMPAVDDARSAADPARYWTRVQAGDRYYTLANNNAAFTFRYQGGSFIAPAIQMNIVRAEPVPPDVRLGNLVWL